MESKGEKHEMHLIVIFQDPESHLALTKTQYGGCWLRIG